MYLLSSQQLMTIWERGNLLHPIERVLLILNEIVSPAERQNITEMSVGQCNVKLLKVQETTFSKKMDCFTHCSKCNEPLEFMLDTTKLCQSVNDSMENKQKKSIIESVTLTFRSIAIGDLASIISYNDAKKAKQELIKRCVLSAKHRSVDVPFCKLKQSVIKKLIEKLQAHDPHAEILCDFNCPGCSHQWKAPFKITEFLWEEIVTYGKNFLEDIHCLAMAYGWNESDIISMNSERRKFYLNRVRS